MSSNQASDILSVIIPASNEEDFIADCLHALLSQDETAGAVEVLVVSNASSDRTVHIARSFEPSFAARGWQLSVLDLEEPGKPNALNAGDAAASGDVRVYLDADIRCDPNLLGQLRGALSVAEARYATGTLHIAPARTWITRRYARFWAKLPFVRGGAVGVGLYGANRAGRARWDVFPDIISDDTFVRLQFAPEERIEVRAGYHWPMVEGFANLVRVRKRQDLGVIELRERYLKDLQDEGKARLTVGRLLTLLVSDPIGFLVYFAVHVSVRFRQSNMDWVRGR